MRLRARVEAVLPLGPWTDGSGHWIQSVAIGGLCLDGMTTWYVLSTAGYREINPLLDSLWAFHPLLVAVYFVGFVLGCSTVFQVRRGWLSTMLAAYVIVVMGLFGGLNNLELLVFGGPGLLGFVAETGGLSGLTLIRTLVPACGLVAGFGAARLRHGPLPWRSVAAVVTAVVVSNELVYRTILDAVRLLGG